MNLGLQAKRAYVMTGSPGLGAQQSQVHAVYVLSNSLSCHYQCMTHERCVT